MPPRRRKPENKDLPLNMYTNTVGGTVYYYFEHPIQHWREQLGTDRVSAVRTAKALNSAIEREGINPAERAPKILGKTVSEVIAEYLPKALAKSRSKLTHKNYTNQIERLDQQFGRRPLKAITVLELSEYLNPLPDRTYIVLRRHLVGIFALALARGYLPHGYGNPAEVLEKRSEPDAVRERLTLEDYHRIYQRAPEWLQIGMELMLHTGLRPIDSRNLRFDQFMDGCLYTEIRKNCKHICIELNDYEQSLIKRARKSGIASPYIIHTMPRRRGLGSPSKDKAHPTQLTHDQFSRTFSNIRDELGIGGENPPPLYEIRSLSSWLYEQAGRDIDGIRALMAHTGERMTEHYIYDRRHEFERVQAGLVLPKKA